MKINALFLIASALSILSCDRKQAQDHHRAVRFYVDPATSSDDPEKRMAYGLNIVPPWPEGGSVFVNLPEHLEYMPETMGIARHHDKRANVWQVAADSAGADYSVESLTEPGVFFSARARARDNKALFEVTITNRSEKILRSIRPLFCFQYHHLSGFPARLSDNFQHTFILMKGKPVAVSDLAVEKPDALARMAQVRDCPDEHNWWAEEMGGFIPEKIDSAVTVLTASGGSRKVTLRWTPGKNFLSNRYIPCIHADPCVGDLEPGQSRTVTGALVFTE
ncbi:MAG TPA: hypothetical protein VF490_20610 [Chryseosolibacter sp.]